MKASVVLEAAREIGLDAAIIDIMFSKFLVFRTVARVKAKNPQRETIYYRYPLLVVFVIKESGHIRADVPMVVQDGGYSLHPHIAESNRGAFCFGDNLRSISAELRKDSSKEDAVAFLIKIRVLLNSYTSGAYRSPGESANDRCYCLTDDPSSPVCGRCMVECALSHIKTPVSEIVMHHGLPVSRDIIHLLGDCPVCGRRTLLPGKKICPLCASNPCALCGRRRIAENQSSCEVEGCQLLSSRS